MEIIKTIHSLISLPAFARERAAAEGAQVGVRDADAPARASESAQVSDDSGTVGVFITPQSVVTFPVASGAVVLVWKVLGKALSLSNSKTLPIAISFVVGMFIYYVSLNPKGTRRDNVIGLG